MMGLKDKLGDEKIEEESEEEDVLTFWEKSCLSFKLKKLKSLST